MYRSKSHFKRFLVAGRYVWIGLAIYCGIAGPFIRNADSTDWFWKPLWLLLAGFYVYAAAYAFKLQGRNRD